jgi:glycosyltransferase involved in cell wall biosynthesis
MSERVKVLHVSGAALAFPYFRAIMGHTDRERFEPVFCSVGLPGTLQEAAAEAGLRSFALGARTRAEQPRAIGGLARLLGRERPQIVQTHLLDGCLVGLTAARLARRPLTVLTGHHSHEGPIQDSLPLKLAERANNGPLSDRIVAPCEDMRRIFTEVQGVPADKVSVIHYAFDFDRLVSHDGARDRVRTELGLDGQRVLGAVGRYFWVKNYEALFRAFAAVARDEPDTKLVVVGQGDPGETAALVRALGIADRVLLSGARDDVPDVLSAIDVFVHPAIAESFGQVIVEAMALRRPVMSTPVGIAPELLSDGAAGVLAADTSAPALERALRQVLGRRGEWGAMGAEGARRVTGFTGERMVAEYERHYLEWLAT